jgi:CrcB protein
VTALLVAVGGALGALSRYGVGALLGGRAFPWATLTVNVIGSLALGYVLGGPATRWDPAVATTVTVGFLGAFTTFSTFSGETTALLRDGRAATALLYVAASVGLGLAGAAAGFLAARAPS